MGNYSKVDIYLPSEITIKTKKEIILELIIAAESKPLVKYERTIESATRKLQLYIC